MGFSRVFSRRTPSSRTGLGTSGHSRRRPRYPARRGFRPTVEQLEERTVPSASLLQQLPLPPGADPTNLVNVNGTLFFAATDPVHGRELWKSDGTTAGTVMVKDLRPGPWNANPTDLTNVNGTLFFAADGPFGLELWKSDGTAAGTVVVKDIRPGPLSSYPEDLTNVDGTLFFTADDGVHGRALWKSDGTAAGTVMVSNVLDASQFTNVNGTLFFVGEVPGSPGTYGLCKSDGTAAGTVLVSPLTPYSDMTSLHGACYFIGFDQTGKEGLWKSDGTPAGTTLVAAAPNGDGFGDGLTATSTRVFFTGFEEFGPMLWTSDGTAAGTLPVGNPTPHTPVNVFPDDSPPTLLGVNSTLFFAGSDGRGDQFWKSDGTVAGTVLVKDINPGGGDSQPQNLTNVNGMLYFTADDGTRGRELWQSDGSATGTVLVDDLNPGPGASNPQNLTNVNGTLYFTADDGVHGTELWKLNPTGNGPGATFYVGRAFVRTTEGKPFTGVVATFQARNPQAPASEFTATVSWGDGHVSTGTITAQGGGRFSVTASNTYAFAGSFLVGVTIQDTSGYAATAGSLAAVDDAPLTGTDAKTVYVGLQYYGAGSVLLATFTDAAGALPASAYHAGITWGNGWYEPGQVTVAGNTISVYGDTFNGIPTPGVYHPLVELMDQGGSVAYAHATVEIAPMILVDITPASLTLNPGSGLLSGTVTLTNPSGGTAISGTVRILFVGLDPSVTLANASGHMPWGDPYINLPNSSLAPGGSLDIPVVFSDPLGLVIRYQIMAFASSFLG